MLSEFRDAPGVKEASVGVAHEDVKEVPLRDASGN